MGTADVGEAQGWETENSGAPEDSGRTHGLYAYPLARRGVWACPHAQVPHPSGATSCREAAPRTVLLIRRGGIVCCRRPQTHPPRYRPRAFPRPHWLPVPPLQSPLPRALRHSAPPRYRRPLWLPRAAPPRGVRPPPPSPSFASLQRVDSFTTNTPPPCPLSAHPSTACICFETRR